jgi:GDPmannose 4,6-dehydratase
LKNAINIVNGKKKMFLGNLNSKRDWGYAPEYTEAMWKMLQSEIPKDLVIASGETHSVREFIEKAFSIAGYIIEWRGSGIEEEGICKKTKDVLVKIDPYYFRPTEVDLLHGDPSKAHREIGWKSRVKFDELVKIMMVFELDKLTSQQ